MDVTCGRFDPCGLDRCDLPSAERFANDVGSALQARVGPIGDDELRQIAAVQQTIPAFEDVIAGLDCEQSEARDELVDWRDCNGSDAGPLFTLLHESSDRAGVSAKERACVLVADAALLPMLDVARAAQLQLRCSVCLAPFDRKIQ